MIKTAERVTKEEGSDNYVFQRSIIAYYEAANLISGEVLEIGTGSGYGIHIIGEKSNKLTTVDKFKLDGLDNLLAQSNNNIEFKQMVVPSLSAFGDNSFDFVVSFQLIEHIKDDKKLVEEIHRVLRPGGKFIVSTPNIKMSLSRNPFHIREYTVDGLFELLNKNFNKVDKKGVFGNDTVMDYYQKNKESVKRYTRFDVFNLQYNLPRFMLQIPYDIMNRLNRVFLFEQNNTLVSNIKKEDFEIMKADDVCLDLFYIAEK